MRINTYVHLPRRRCLSWARSLSESFYTSCSRGNSTPGKTTIEIGRPPGVYNMFSIETLFFVAVLAAPPILLGGAALSAAWLHWKGTLRRSLAYLIVSRTRRNRFIALSVLGMLGFVVAGTVGVLGLMGTVTTSAVDMTSGAGYLLGATAIFATARVGLRDTPIVTCEQTEVEQFRGEVLSLGLVNGLDQLPIETTADAISPR